jgi:hypothetical protein
MMCGNACVDTQTSHAHCGDCNKACSNTQACVAGKCEDCGAAGGACCQNALAACANGLVCSGTPGQAGAVCGCTSPREMCGQACVDTSTNREHCGSCDNACGDTQVCMDLGKGPTCTTCGTSGSPCCVVGTYSVCGRGLTCNAQKTCEASQAGTPGGAGGVPGGAGGTPGGAGGATP